MTANADIKYINEKEWADIRRCSRSTVQKERLYGTGAAFYKGPGRRGSVIYRLDEALAWLESHKRTSTSDSGQEVG